MDNVEEGNAKIQFFQQKICFSHHISAKLPNSGTAEGCRVASLGGENKRVTHQKGSNELCFTVTSHHCFYACIEVLEKRKRRYTACSDVQVIYLMRKLHPMLHFGCQAVLYIL